MKLSNKKIWPFIALIVSVFFIVIFVDRHTLEIKKVLEVGIGGFIYISFFVGAVFIVNGLKNKLLVKPFGAFLKPSEWFGLSIVNNFWNYLPFQGGLIAKGAYLKRKYKLPYPEYLSVITASYLITFCVFSVIGCLGLILYYFEFWEFSWYIWLLYAVLFGASLLLMIFLYYQKSAKYSWIFLRRFIDGIQLIAKHQKIIQQLIVLDILIVVLYAVRLFIVSYFLGYQIPFFFYCLVAPVSLLSIFTSLTPGGLVVREILFGIFAAWLTVSVSESVTVAVLDRGVSMAWVFLLGPVFNYYLSKNILNKKFKLEANNHDQA